MLLVSGTAWGHAQVIDVIPADGARLATSPPAISVTFSEAVQPLRVSLHDGRGNALPVSFDRIAAESLSVTIPELADGHYLFSFRVASGDGHPIARATTFQVGEVDATAVRGLAAQQGPATGGSAFGHLLRFGTTGLVLLSLGMFLYCQIVRKVPSPTEPALHGAALALVGLSLVMFLPGYSGAGIAVFTDWPLLAMLLRQNIVIGQLLFAASFLVFVIAARKDSVAIAAVALCGVLLGKATAGHTVTAAWPPAPSLLLILHLLLVAFWIGSLVYLYEATRRNHGGLHALMQRFSALALPAVILILASGVALSLLLVGDWRRLFSNPYSQLLLSKVIIVGAVCIIALANKRSLTPQLIDGGDHARLTLQRNIRLELILLLAVVAITSVLAVTPPAGTEENHVSESRTALFESQGYELTLTFEPVPGGALEVALLQNGQNVEALEVTLLWKLPGIDAEVLPRTATKHPAGFATTLPAIAAQSWDVDIEVLVDDFTSIRLNGRIEL